MPGFASVMALSETWNFFAILSRISPLAMAYSATPAATTGCVGGSTAAGAVTAAGGVLVEVATGGLVVSTNAGGWLLATVSGCGAASFDCPQPCISRAIRPMP